MKARFWEKIPETFEKAKAYYEEAIARDPNFALAYDAIAEMYWYQGFYGHRSCQRRATTGTFYATYALELDPTLAETHALLSHYRKELAFDWGEVKREIDIARKLDSRASALQFGRRNPGVGSLLSQLQTLFESIYI